MSMPLHVANGHCTTRLIESSGVPGRTMAWCDPLTDGPVPGDVSDDNLVRVRAAFLAESPAEVDGVAADLSEWRRAVDQNSDDELVLWFEHDLFDQLNLVQLLSHVAPRADTGRRISLVSVDAFPGHPHFKGLGELTPQDIATLFAARSPVSHDQLALAPRAWASFRSADPRALEAFLQTDTSALPFLARALARHLEEFPSDTNGLSKSEQRLLELAAAGPAPLEAVLPRMHDGETAYYMTDSSLVDRVRELASTSSPLLTYTGGNAANILTGTIGLTEDGQRVLRGDADRVRVCGIDRWLGGVHLAGRGPAWRWSARESRLMEG